MSAASSSAQNAPLPFAGDAVLCLRDMAPKP
jgi:hypothetical protein